jgi:hypothetical protein
MSLLDLLRGQPQQAQQQAMPQQPRQGGGMGDILSALGPAIAMLDPRNQQLGAYLMQAQQGKKKDARNQELANQTVEWLRSRGVSDDEARFLASDNDALRQWYNAQRPDPEGALKQEYMRAQIANMESQIADRNNPLTKSERGLQPQFGVDDQGNPIIMQLGKDGTAVRTQLPEGVRLSKEPIRLDAGTHFVLLDPITRQPIGQIEKDLGGAASATAQGKAQGEAAATLPAAAITARQTIGYIDELLTHPGLESSVGTVQGRMPDWLAGNLNPHVADFRSRLDQARGTAFLEAYNGLRGGGQITEIEGKKAEDALARLNQAVSETDFKRALRDFREAVELGYQKLATRAGQGGGMPAPQTGGEWQDMGNGIKMRVRQ